MLCFQRDEFAKKGRSYQNLEGVVANSLAKRGKVFATGYEPQLQPCPAAQVKQHIPKQPGWKNSKYWANIEKRNQINAKNYWK